MTEILFAFDTTTGAIRAEQALLTQGIAVRVMSLPSSIRAGCGICLRVSPAEVPAATKTLQAGGVKDYQLYIRQTEDGKSRYTPCKQEDFDA